MTNSSFASAGIDAGFLQRARIVDANGKPVQLIAVEQGGTDLQARMRLHNGMQLLVPLALFLRDGEDSCRLPLAADDAAGAVLPVREESVNVGKRKVEVPRGIRLHRHVDEHVEQVLQSLSEDVIEVERVEVGTIVDAGHPPQVREEGELLVVPVLEEVLVVQKQLRLREELRIRRKRRLHEERQSVSLRRERVEVEQFDETDGGSGSAKENGPAQA